LNSVFVCCYLPLKVVFVRQRKMRESQSDVQQFLKRRDPAWNLVGRRVHFNLAVGEYAGHKQESSVGAAPYCAGRATRLLRERTVSGADPISEDRSACRSVFARKLVVPRAQLRA
jgi:hypothetical protein